MCLNNVANKVKLKNQPIKSEWMWRGCLVPKAWEVARRVPSVSWISGALILSEYLKPSTGKSRWWRVGFCTLRHTRCNPHSVQYHLKLIGVKWCTHKGAEGFTSNLPQQFNVDETGQLLRKKKDDRLCFIKKEKTMTSFTIFYSLFLLLFNYSCPHFSPITLPYSTHPHLPHSILPRPAIPPKPVVFVHGSFTILRTNLCTHFEELHLGTENLKPFSLKLQICRFN